MTTDTEIRILKTASCPSLSGKSKLTYEIGCNGGAEIHARVIKNSGTGWFSPVWVALPRVHDLLARNGDKPIAFSTLLPIFKGRSVNNAGFLLAVLKHEGLVQAMPDNPRSYKRREAKAFFAEVNSLMGAHQTKAAKPKVAKAVTSRAPKAAAAKR